MRLPFLVSLDPNESVILTGPTQKVIKHGPGWVTLGIADSVKKIKKIILTAEEYLIVTHFVQDADHGDIIEHIAGPFIFEQQSAMDTVAGPYKKTELSGTQYVICTNPKNGHKRTVKGPSMFMPEPYEIVGTVQNTIPLTVNQYMFVTDSTTGHIKCVSGPDNYACEPFDKPSDVRTKVDLSNTQYLTVTDTKTAVQKTEVGPQQFVPGPYDSFGAPKNMLSLSNVQYVYVNDKMKAEWKLVRGPVTFYLNPFETASEIKNVIYLNMIQWIKIVDGNSGKIRIVRGPDTVILNTFESVIKDNGSEIQQAFTVDANHCVHVRDVETGLERLITEPQKYIPEAPNIQVVGVQDLVKLAPYECMILIDRESKMLFHYGKDSSGFFIPPFCNIYSQAWSTDRNRKIKGNTTIQRFDMRYHDMDFEFTVRSGDNVEIKLVVNVYWSINDVEKMVRATNDPPQDICNHVRSQIISFASQMTTKQLMEQPASDIIKQIHDADNEFYKTRGVSVSRVNILEKCCADPEIDRTYRAIIDQKITRAKNLEQQLGENDKEIARINGLTAIEIQTYKLLEQKLKNLELETETSGKAEGGKIKSFLDGLGDDISLEQKIQIFLQIERTKRINMITEKVNTLYLNPSDVDFNLDVIRFEDKNVSEQAGSNQPRVRDSQSETNSTLLMDADLAKKETKKKTSVSINLNK